MVSLSGVRSQDKCLQRNRNCLKLGSCLWVAALLFGVHTANSCLLSAVHCLDNPYRFTTQKKQLLMNYTSHPGHRTETYTTSSSTDSEVLINNDSCSVLESVRYVSWHFMNYVHENEAFLEKQCWAFCCLRLQPSLLIHTKWRKHWNAGWQESKALV